VTVTTTAFSLAADDAEAITHFIDSVRASAASGEDGVSFQKEVATEKENEGWSMNLVYGEMRPAAVAALLEGGLSLCTRSQGGAKGAGAGAGAPAGSPSSSPSPTAPTRSRYIVDLGSGEGVPCLVSALWLASRQEAVAGAAVGEENRCGGAGLPSSSTAPSSLSPAPAPAPFVLEGIELLPRLHRTAERLLATARKLLDDDEALPIAAAVRRRDEARALLAGLPVPASPSTSSAPLSSRLDSVKLTMGSFLVVDWSAADLVFCNGTCYDDAILHSLWRAMEKLSPGAIVVLTSHKIPSKLFELLHEATYASSWGTVSARIYRRVNLPRWVAGVLGRPRR
jgi:hypothetical protein